ncbi:MAG: glycosyltransferase family 4 protein [Oscillospiraceae bacterium]|nr:glycosyltransferase family 4 protein [Oscillospiraceae bacterium]
MKVAVFSPLNPIKSGISDYTQEVVLKLKEYVDIDLFVDGYKPCDAEIKKNFKIFNMEEIENAEVRRNYDLIIYQIGNSYKHHEKIVNYSLKYPGIVEMHDFALHYLIASTLYTTGKHDEYIQVMKYCHGRNGEYTAKKFLRTLMNPPWDKRSLEFPVNKHILDNSIGIIVHSDYALQMIKGMKVDKPLTKINLHSLEIIEDFDVYQKKCRAKLGIDQKKVILGSFGFASTAKRIYEILEALALLKKDYNNFIYYVIGEEDNVDVRAKAEELGLSKNVVITGFVGLDKFSYYIGASDICFNLRYPTQGESSASLHRALGMGKLVFVTKIGTFKEYPDNAVVKINYDQYEVQNIYLKLIEILKDKNKMIKMKENALLFAKENCSLESNCIKYYTFINDIINGKKSKIDYIDTFVDGLYELELHSEKYIKQLGERVGAVI